MASYNRVVLIGNLTRDPELRYIPSGTAVSEIGLAVNDRVKRNDQWASGAAPQRLPTNISAKVRLF